MKKILLLALLALTPLLAQSRTVNVSWTASGTTGITGYVLSRGTTAAGPFVAIATLGSSSTSFQDNNITVGSTYTYQLVANAAACTPTTPTTQACGSSVPVTASTTVPPQPGATITITLTVP